jgi:mono/diheme cytochrome c family protein
VSGPLRVVVYGLNGSETPTIVKLERSPILPSPATGDAANLHAVMAVCSTCHGVGGKSGGTGPPLIHQTEMGDAENLKAFLKSVQPPMPILYPGLLEDKDVEMIAAYLRTLAASTNDKLPKGEQLPTAPYVQPKSSGSPEWQAVYSVVTSPRCINCHTATNYPRQGDDRHPHIYGVIRGDVVPFETARRCCSSAARAAAATCRGRRLRPAGKR